MTVVRELVARLGFQVDKSGFAAAERGVAAVRGALAAAGGAAGKTQAGLTASGAAAAALGRGAQTAAAGVGMAGNALGAFGKLAAAAGLTHVLKSMVEMASDANETGNVLGEVFGPAGAAQIKAWSDAMATEMGRSRYDLQAYAGRLGSVIEPMIRNKEKTQEMSTALSALAVDLGSFYNVADADALGALRSGLTGEYESLKRLGIVMNEATLADFARTQGIKKKVTAMSIAEKTELRYGFVMANSTAAQGDAKRTGDGYANSIKALKASMSELGTEMGMAVIPKLERLVRYARDSVTVFKKLAEGTHVLEAAMYGLGAIAAMIALSLVSAFILPALGVAGLILLIDELYNLFTGGRSVIGDWLDEWGGLGTADSLVTQITDDFRAFMDTMDELPDVQGSWELFAGSIEDVGFAVDRLADKMLWFLSGPGRWWTGAMGKLNHAFRMPETELGKQRRLEFEASRPKGRTDPNLNQHVFEDGSQPTVIRTQVNMFRQERAARVRRETEERRAAKVARRKQARVDRELAKEDATMSRDAPIDPVAAAASLRFGRRRIAAPASAPAQAAPANMSVNNNTSITVVTDDPQKIKRAVVEVLDSRDRATMSSLPSEGEG